MNNWQQHILGNVADIKLSNVDKITNKNEKVVKLCNYTDVYRNSFINKEKAQGFMTATCDENEFKKLPDDLVNKFGLTIDNLFKFAT